MKRLAAVCLAMLLVACSSDPKISSATEHSVIMDLSGTESREDEAKALTIADKHCAKHKRHARYKGPMSPTLIVFDCVN